MTPAFFKYVEFYEKHFGILSLVMPHTLNSEHSHRYERCWAIKYII